ncbi:TPA: hypothetical protein ACGR6T_004740 [Klebsiella aerogenes]
MITKKIKNYLTLSDNENLINSYYESLTVLEKRYFLVEILNSYISTRSYLKTTINKISFLEIKDLFDEMNFIENEKFTEEDNTIIKLVNFLFDCVDDKKSYLEYFEMLNLRISDYRKNIFTPYMKFFKYEKFDYKSENSKYYYISHQKYVFSECLNLLSERSLHKLAIFNDFRLDGIVINLKNDEFEKSHTYLTYAIFEVILKCDKSEDEKYAMLDYLFKIYIEKRFVITNLENMQINSNHNELLKKVLKKNYNNESFIHHNTYIPGVNPFTTRNNNQKKLNKLIEKIS